MTPLDRIALTYVRHGHDFAAALEDCYQTGRVYSTETFFIMGKRTGPRTWMIVAMAGDMSDAWRILPDDCDHVSFYRFDNSLRTVPVSVLKRLTYHEVALPASPA